MQTYATNGLVTQFPPYILQSLVHISAVFMHGKIQRQLQRCTSPLDFNYTCLRCNCIERDECSRKAIVRSRIFADEKPPRYQLFLYEAFFQHTKASFSVIFFVFRYSFLPGFSFVCFSWNTFSYFAQTSFLPLHLYPKVTFRLQLSVRFQGMDMQFNRKDPR